MFLPNYNVSLAEVIIPAADLSEQISTAGMEASGTGNMKLALNGALTIGTLDGANIEIRERVGADNIFIFGLTAPRRCANGARRLRFRATPSPPRRGSRACSTAIASGAFSPEEPSRFAPIVDAPAHRDRFMVTADFDAYWAAQRRVDTLWRDAGGVVGGKHPQHRPHGLVLLRPDDPRVCRRDLERAEGGVTAPSGSPLPAGALMRIPASVAFVIWIVPPDLAS